MSPREQQIAAIQQQDGPGRHTVLECVLCGTCIWNGSDHHQPDGVVFQACTPSRCPCCQEVLRRAPEIWNFVAGVAGMLELKLRELREHVAAQAGDAAADIDE